MAMYQGYAERYEDLVGKIVRDARDREIWEEVTDNLRNDSAVENAVECAIEDAMGDGERMERVILDDVRRRVEEVFSETILDRLDADPKALEAVVEGTAVREAVGRVYYETEEILDAAFRERIERYAEAEQDGNQVTFAISMGRSYEWTEYDRSTLDERLRQLRGIVERAVEEAEDAMLPRRFDAALADIRRHFESMTVEQSVMLLDRLAEIIVNLDREAEERTARLRLAEQAEDAAQAEAAAQAEDAAQDVFAEARQTEEILAMLDGDAAQALAAQAASEAAALAQFDEDEGRVLAMRQGDVDAATTDEERAAALARLAESRSTWAAVRLSRFGRKEG